MWPNKFSGRGHDVIDAVSKIAGVCLVLFYVVQYSLDVYREERNEQQSAAIGYINRFSDGDVLEARLALLDFWRERERLADLGVSGAITSENFGRLLMDELEEAPELLSPLKHIGYLFDELYYCYSAGICDREIVESFFCPHASGYEETYFQFLRASEAQIIGRDLYVGVRELSETCELQDI